MSHINRNLTVAELSVPVIGIWFENFRQTLKAGDMIENPSKPLSIGLITNNQ